VQPIGIITLNQSNLDLAALPVLLLDTGILLAAVCVIRRPEAVTLFHLRVITKGQADEEAR
jgi:hypothetical protein